MKNGRLEQRLRQLNAADRNALDIYTDLKNIVTDKGLKEEFARVARDEARHIADSKILLSLIAHAE